MEKQLVETLEMMPQLDNSLSLLEFTPWSDSLQLLLLNNFTIVDGYIFISFI